MYDTAFNKIERELRNEEGVANELDYVEQTSWVLFLKYLHDLEAERRNRAELDGTDYSPILAGPYAWEQWAAPKTDEQFDHNKARIGEDLIQFVNTELFPYLASFRQSASGPLRLIRAMIEFKQIIGRGTRAYEGKDFFSIWDFVQGHQNFNDPEWDGDPIDPAPPGAGAAYIAPATVQKYGGQFLARGYPVALRESGQQERTVVGVWESLDVALQWYESPEYQECLDVLGDGAVRDIKFLEHI